MRKLILAPALALALAATAFAEGDMQFGRTATQPTPTPTPNVMGGAAPSDCAITTQEVDDQTEALLNLIATVLALL